MLVLMLMLMSHASVDFFVLSFVLPCAYAYVASENQALEINCENLIACSWSNLLSPGCIYDVTNFQCVQDLVFCG